MPFPSPPLTLRPISVARSTCPTTTEGFSFDLIWFLIRIKSHDDKKLISIRPIYNHRIRKSYTQGPSEIITVPSQVRFGARKLTTNKSAIIYFLYLNGAFKSTYKVDSVKKIASNQNAAKIASSLIKAILFTLKTIEFQQNLGLVIIYYLCIKIYGLQQM